MKQIILIMSKYIVLTQEFVQPSIDEIRLVGKVSRGKIMVTLESGIRDLLFCHQLNWSVWKLIPSKRVFLMLCHNDVPYYVFHNLTLTSIYWVLAQGADLICLNPLKCRLP